MGSTEGHLSRGGFFFYLPTAENGGGEFVLSERSGGPRKVVNTIVFHSMVMPAIEETEAVSPDIGPVMSVQRRAEVRASFLGKLAIGKWLVLLALGLWRFLFLGRQHRFRIVLLSLFLASWHFTYTSESRPFSIPCTSYRCWLSLPLWAH